MSNFKLKRSNKGESIYLKSSHPNSLSPTSDKISVSLQLRNSILKKIVIITACNQTIILNPSFLIPVLERIVPNPMFAFGAPSSLGPTAEITIASHSHQTWHRIHKKHNRKADSTHWPPCDVMLSLLAFNFYVHSQAQQLFTHNFYNLTAAAWAPRVEKENVFPLINHADTY